MLTTQNGLQIRFFSLLGENILGVRGLQGTEKACSCFCFTLDLFSLETSIDLSSLIGKPACLAFTFGSNVRYFSGIIGEFQQGSTVPDDKGLQTLYTAKLYPTFWLLSFTKDYRIFQFMSALEIIKKVLSENGVTRLDDRTTSCGRKNREFCVQYGESHYNFVCRLMEEEGIFYSFKHTLEGDILILNDDSLTSETATGSPFKIVDTQATSTGPNQISFFALQEQVISKTYAAADYNFQTASVPLYSQLSGEENVGKIYDYPGLYATSIEGELLTNHKRQEYEWFQKQITGKSTAPFFSPLIKIEISNHPREDANRAYILYEVKHSLIQVVPLSQTGGSESRINLYSPLLYENTYSGFPDDLPFRAACITPRPLISSSQTARVTGKPGEEIWVDDYGRIKVKFHWDQYGTDDDKSSCWIRVAQVLAGNQWGSLWTPRVGMEVVVIFLDGNPDRPLITGCVYNSDHRPPYLPDEPTKSIIISSPPKEGAAYNELLFDDKPGKEELCIQAGKDMKTIIKGGNQVDIITGDDTTAIHQGNRNVILQGEEGDRPQGGDDTLTLQKGKRLIELKAEGEIPASHTTCLHNGNKVTTILKGNQETTLNEGSHLVTLYKGDETILVGEGNQTVTLKMGDQTLTLVQGNQTLTLSEGNRSLILSNGNESITIKGQRSLLITAEEEHTNQSDYTHTVIKNHTLKVNGDLNIEVLGTTTLTSRGNFSLECLANVNMRSTGNFTIEAMNVSIQSAINSSVEAGVNLNFKSMATEE